MEECAWTWQGGRPQDDERRGLWEKSLCVQDSEDEKEVNAFLSYASQLVSERLTELQVNLACLPGPYVQCKIANVLIIRVTIKHK